MGRDTCIMKLLAYLLLTGLATARPQDTTYCNDGWELYTVEWQGQAHHSCFWFGTNYEKVTHDSAKLICESMGGFMAEVPYGPHLNNWLVNKLIERNTKNNDLPDLKSTGEGGLGAPVYETQYWLGARDFAHHNDHMPGHWMWEHRNSSVEWFDWGPNEPNNYRGQNCLTLLQYRDVIFGRYSTFHWNDWDCDQPQDFICEIIID